MYNENERIRQNAGMVAGFFTACGSGIIDMSKKGVINAGLSNAGVSNQHSTFRQSHYYRLKCGSVRECTKIFTFRYSDIIGPRDSTRRFAFYHTWLKFYDDIGIPFHLPNKIENVSRLFEKQTQLPSFQRMNKYRFVCRLKSRLHMLKTQPT